MNLLPYGTWKFRPDEIRQDLSNGRTKVLMPSRFLGGGEPLGFPSADSSHNGLSRQNVACPRGFL